MSWFGKNAVWFCHVLLLDESEHPVEIRVSKQTYILNQTLGYKNLLCFVSCLLGVNAT